jgi:hypothetical protein
MLVPLTRLITGTSTPSARIECEAVRTRSCDGELSPSAPAFTRTGRDAPAQLPLGPVRLKLKLAMSRIADRPPKRAATSSPMARVSIGR